MNQPPRPRQRVWIDNDFSGDPDDLFQLAHHLLCDSVEVRGITGSHLAEPPPGARGLEYNLNIDLRAAQFLFNETMVPIWQVPRDAYRQCLVSLAELEVRLGGSRLGRHLVRSLDRVFAVMDGRGWPRGETYALGDQPLVLLTALQSFFDPFPSSCRSVVRDTPVLRDDGTYGPGTGSRPLRIFTQLDTRLMFEDLYARVGPASGD